MYIKAAKFEPKGHKNFRPYYIKEDILKYDGSNWVSVDNDVREIPYTPGNQNSYSLNGVVEQVTADNFALENEYDLYMNTVSRPYNTSPAHISQREPGGFRIATIYYPGDGTAATLQKGISKYDMIPI
ncbi:MAG: hypothetical protein ABEK59_02835 [Halobacteria archaeon]